jgi:hypothetical protein
LRYSRLIGGGNMPQDDMRMRLLHAGMPGVEIDIDMVDIAAGRGEVLRRPEMLRIGRSDRGAPIVNAINAVSGERIDTFSIKGPAAALSYDTRCRGDRRPVRFR